MKTKQERSASSKRVKDLITIASNFGLTRLKVGDIEIEMNPKAKLKDKIDNSLNSIDSKIEREPTEDEMLLYSTGAYDHVRAEREPK